MATSSANKNKLTPGPGSEIGILVNQFLPGAGNIDAIDQRILHAPTDGGCVWSESCTEDDLVCIDGIWYYTWKFKGIKQDYCPDEKDPGIHIPLSCNPDQIGIRFNGSHVLESIISVCDTDEIQAFCDWLFENCLNTEAFMNWVCDTVTNHCLPNPSFAAAFCEWFIDSLLSKSEFAEVFLNWIFSNITTDQSIIDRVCEIILFCLQDNEGVRDQIREVIKDCLLNSELIKSILESIILGCLDNQSIIDKICEIFKVDCVTSSNWNSDSDSSPTGNPSDAWYLIDDASGNITHVSLNGLWACLASTV